MEYFGLTDVGKKRSENQDCFKIKKLSEDSLLLAVFDGMGGARGGATASAVASDIFVSTAAKEISPADSDGDLISALHYAVGKANESVYVRSEQDEELSGMGTTVAAVVIRKDIKNTDPIDFDMKTYDPKNEHTYAIAEEDDPDAPSIGVFVVNVGDSRTYISDEKGLHQLSKDHSYVQYLIDKGELSPKKAANHPQRNVITKAIGIDSMLIPDVEKHSFPEEGERYVLLCSDGLYSEVKEEDIQKILRSDMSVEDKAVKLVARANKKGGRDNITVVIARL